MLLECNSVRLLVVDVDHLALREVAHLHQLSRRFQQTAVFMGQVFGKVKL